MLTFKDFLLVSESPDKALLLNGEELVWADPQARPFGFLHIEHEHFHDLLNVMKNNQAFLDSDKYIVGSHGQAHFQVVRIFLKQFEQNIDKEPYLKLLNTFVLDHANLRKCLQPCGRIWLLSKVISFWCKKSQVTIEQIEKIFNSVYIPQDRWNSFKLEFIGDEHPLLSYQDFCTQHSSTDTDTTYTSKELELLKRVHTAAANPEDKELQNFIKKRKEERANASKGPKIPLNIRQQITTSESRYL
jgi:hypothetical protein